MERKKKRREDIKKRRETGSKNGKQKERKKEKTKQTKENQWKYEVMEVRKGMQRKKGKHKEILLKFFHDFLLIL